MMVATLQKNIKALASGAPTGLLGVDASGKAVLGTVLPASVTLYSAAGKVFQLDLDPVAGYGRIQANGGGNVLVIRNQSSNQYSESAITFADSSASNSGNGKEMLAIGHDNGGSNAPFSLINFVETSNDPQNPASQAPTTFAIIQTGYLNSLYSSRNRFEVKNDGTVNFYSGDNLSNGVGTLMLSIPLLAASPVYVGALSLQLGGTSSAFPMLKRSGAGFAVRAADDSGAGGFSAFSYNINASGFLSAGGDGIFQMSNNASNAFNRLMFGGSTSSFPALKRSTTTLQVRLADDSADAILQAADIILSSVPTADPHVVGKVWANSGILTLSAG